MSWNWVLAAVRAFIGQAAVRFPVNMCPWQVEWVAVGVVDQLRLHFEIPFFRGLFSPGGVFDTNGPSMQGIPKGLQNSQ